MSKNTTIRSPITSGPPCLPDVKGTNGSISWHACILFLLLFLFFQNQWDFQHVKKTVRNIGNHVREFQTRESRARRRRKGKSTQEDVLSFPLRQLWRELCSILFLKQVLARHEKTGFDPYLWPRTQVTKAVFSKHLAYLRLRRRPSSILVNDSTPWLLSKVWQRKRERWLWLKSKVPLIHVKCAISLPHVKPLSKAKSKKVYAKDSGPYLSYFSLIQKCSKLIFCALWQSYSVPCVWRLQ